MDNLLSQCFWCVCWAMEQRRWVHQHGMKEVKLCCLFVTKGHEEEKSAPHSGHVCSIWQKKLITGLFHQLLLLKLKLQLVDLFNRGGHTGPRKKFNFFGAPIQKAHEYVLNLRRQLSSSILRFAAHMLNFGVFPVTKHPFFSFFHPKGFSAKKK